VGEGDEAGREVEAVNVDVEAACGCPVGHVFGEVAVGAADVKAAAGAVDGVGDELAQRDPAVFGAAEAGLFPTESSSSRFHG
jgi:hypothetical protein